MSSCGGLEERSCLSAGRMPATKGVAPVPPAGPFFPEPPAASPLIFSRRLPVNRRRKGHVPRKRIPHTQGPPAPLAPHNGESEAVPTSAAAAAAVAAPRYEQTPRS